MAGRFNPLTESVHSGDRRYMDLFADARHGISGTDHLERHDAKDHYDRLVVRHLPDACEYNLTFDRRESSCDRKRADPHRQEKPSSVDAEFASLSSPHGMPIDPRSIGMLVYAPRISSTL